MRNLHWGKSPIFFLTVLQLSPGDTSRGIDSPTGPVTHTRIASKTPDHLYFVLKVPLCCLSAPDGVGPVSDLAHRLVQIVEGTGTIIAAPYTNS